MSLLDLVNLTLPGPFLHPGTLYPSGPHLDLVNLVPIWVSPRSGDFDPHLDLIAVNSFLASPATGDSDPIYASPRSGDSGPHLGIIRTWCLSSTPEAHLDPMTLGPLWASRRPGDSRPHLDITWTR